MRKLRGAATLALVGLAALAAGAVGAGGAHFVDIDEPKYAAAGLEMLVSGDWLRPMVNGFPRLEKPPLVYWLMQPAFKAAMALGGPAAATPLVARTPSLLAAALVAILTAIMGRRLLGARAGLAAGLILPASAVFHVLSHILKVDMVFAAAMAAASCGFVLRLKGEAKGWSLALILAGLGMGGLAKGPFIFVSLAAYAAALASLGLFAPDAGWSERLRAAGRNLRVEQWLFAGGIAAGAAPLAAWLAGAWWVGGVDYASAFADQFVSNSSAGAGLKPWRVLVNPAFYLGFSAMLGLFPWGGWLPGGAVRLLRHVRERDGAWIFLAWLAVLHVLLGVFVFRLRAHRYLLPAFPVFALMIADFLFSPERSRLRRMLFWAGAGLGLATAVVFALRFVAAGAASINLWEGYPVDWSSGPAVLLISGGVLLAAAMAWACRIQSKRPLLHAAVLAASFIVGAGLYANLFPNAAAPEDRRPMLAGRAVELLRTLAPGMLVVHTDSLAAYYPDLHYELALDRAAGRIVYTAPPPRVVEGAQRLAMALLRPQQTAGLAASSRGPGCFPATRYFKSRRFRETALLLTGGERVGLTPWLQWMEAALPVRVESNCFTGYSLKWVEDSMCLVRLHPR